MSENANVVYLPSSSHTDEDSGVSRVISGGGGDQKRSSTVSEEMLMPLLTAAPRWPRPLLLIEIIQK